VNSCSHDNEEKIFLEVSDISLKDLGKNPPHEFKFDMESINGNVQRCAIRTSAIKKNDNIESIEAFVQGNKLSISVTSYPNDFDWDDTDLTMHELSFNLTGINKGSYNVRTRINNNDIDFHYKL
jgi:hypothetical protein